MPEILFETSRLSVRRFSAEDGEAFAAILTDPEVCYFEPYETFSHVDAVMEAAKLAENPEFYAAVRKEDGRLIGKLYLHDAEFFGAFELGYTFLRSVWGQGFASEAVRGLLRYAFEVLDIRRIFAEADVENVRSCRVLERCGFRREALYLQSAAFRKDAGGNPVYGDYCSYALLQSEYRKGEHHAN